MLKRLIRAVRHKPKAVRDQYAFWIAALFTLAVFLIWATGFTGVIEPLTSSEDPAVLPEDRGSLTDMMSGLREDLQDLTAADLENSTSSTATGAVSTTTQPIVRTPTATQPTAPEVRIATYTASTTE